MNVEKRTIITLHHSDVEAALKSWAYNQGHTGHSEITIHTGEDVHGNGTVAATITIKEIE